MFAKRLLESAVLIPVFFAIFYVDHQSGDAALFLLGLCLLLAGRAVWELVALLRLRQTEPSLPWTMACSLAVILAGWRIPGTLAGQCVAGGVCSLMGAFVFAVLLLFVKTAWQYREPGKNIMTLGTELLIVAYAGVLFGVTTQLRWCAGGEAGDLILGSMIIAVKSGDIGAYTFGRLFGRRKMAPRLSPNKTWAGAFGALFTAALGSIAWQQIATPIFNGNWQPCPWCWAAAYGLVLGLAGMIGDLCESLIKRDMGAKDSAPLLPGLGGVLDFLDSILFAGPIAYLWWQVLPLAKW